MTSDGIYKATLKGKKEGNRKSSSGKT